MSGFGICTFVFKKRNLKSLKIKSIKSLSFCGKTGTKGFVASTIQLENKLDKSKLYKKGLLIDYKYTYAL